jgi:tRNA(adenine34) deaminase
MLLAIEEAKKAQNIGEVPVGAIIVMNNQVISGSYNQSISQDDPTSHAEINTLRNAAKMLGNYRLTGGTLYVTLEPCAMCYGAIIHARISRLIFGAYDPKTGVCGSSFNLHEQEFFNHVPQITGGILEEECSLILKDFFKERRN